MAACPDGQILVRATIHLNGDPWPIEPGDMFCVDPTLPRIRKLLEGGDAGGYLVAVDDTWTPEPL